MRTDNNNALLAGKLAECLKLQQPPVAISFSKSVPAGMPGPDGRVAAGCRFWEDAATAAFATSSADHKLCAIGVYTHHLHESPAQQADLLAALKVFGDLGYVTRQDLESIPVLAEPQEHVLYSQLSMAPFAPEAVLLFVKPSQGLILAEATQQVDNQTAPAMGRPACAVVSQVINSGRAAMSLGCCGARAYLDVLADDVAIFALPGAKLEAYVERIEVLVKANEILSSFHSLRRRQVDSGETPTVKESLSAMAN
jgi:uncharacterized protein (DUF169 family)